MAVLLSKDPCGGEEEAVQAIVGAKSRTIERSFNREEERRLARAKEIGFR